jgi:hypothetical protein
MIRRRFERSSINVEPVAVQSVPVVTRIAFVVHAIQSPPLSTSALLREMHCGGGLFGFCCGGKARSTSLGLSWGAYLSSSPFALFGVHLAASRMCESYGMRFVLWSAL